MLRDEHASEDVVQRAFFNIWQTRARIREGSAFGTYLYRVLLNLCINHLHRWKRPIPLSALADDDRPASAMFADPGASEPAAELERAELRLAVAREVAQLYPHYREALRLREYEGLSYAQIATELCATISEVKIWIHRGRRKLLTALEPYLDRGAAMRDTKTPVRPARARVSALRRA